MGPRQRTRPPSTQPGPAGKRGVGRAASSADGRAGGPGEQTASSATGNQNKKWIRNGSTLKIDNLSLPPLTPGDYELVVEYTETREEIKKEPPETNFCKVTVLPGMLLELIGGQWHRRAVVHFYMLTSP